MKSKKRLNLSKDKYCGSDVFDVNIITSLHEFIKAPLQKIFNESLTLNIQVTVYILWNIITFPFFS